MIRVHTLNFAIVGALALEPYKTHTIVTIIMTVQCSPDPAALIKIVFGNA